MSFFNVTIEGIESIQQDLNTETTQIYQAIPTALQQVGSDMIATLQKHINDEWYHRYTPRSYKRRTDNPALGTPLGSESNMAYSVSGASLDFTYIPTGEHQNNSWHTRDGDDLIDSIQLGKLAGSPPPRPFWNSFVNDEEHNGVINSFISGMKSKYQVIEEGNPRDVIGIVNESALEGEIPLNILSDETDDDLPI